MKKDQRIEVLYQRFLNNEATAAELELLLSFFDKGEESALRSAIAASLSDFQDDEAPDAFRVAHLSDLQSRIHERMEPAVMIRGWWNNSFFKVAASLILVAFATLFAYQYFGAAKEEIGPGCNCGMLRTAEGKEIVLSDSNALAGIKTPGVRIRRGKEGQLIYTAVPGNYEDAAVMNTLMTPMGGKYEVRLSDGTTVVLNSGSSLEFPVGFHGSERRVKLSGEAYFEVTKDPLKPFIVESGKGRIKVLGTRFNISNYADDGVLKTTLISGKIEFTELNTAQSVVLKPGEQASVKAGHLQVDPVSAEDFMAWKNDMFVFSNEELSVIMRQLSRWYDVDVDYSTIPDRRLFVRISKGVNLSEVLEQFALTSNLKFKVEGRRISFVN